MNNFLSKLIRKNPNDDELVIYPDSVHRVKGKKVFMVADVDCDYIFATAPDLGFEGEEMLAGNEMWLKAPLNHHNAEVMRRLFPFTAPARVLDRDKTVGTGDRLGVAGDGHIKAFKKYKNVTPILAQQSIRELTLTSRTYNDVLDCATFACFRSGYTGGYGADGDHLKTMDEVEYALGCGYTMITLDCSEHIDNTIDALSDAEVAGRYAPDAELEALYLGKTFDIGEGITIHFDEDMYRRCVLIYGKAVDHAVKVYSTLIATEDGQVADFEMSIDETATPTHPVQHFFVASELARRGVRASTIAPRFCGEFQKGVDYIGDIDQFVAELKVHAQIARHFDYKISVHSGSDKFSIFKYVGEETRGRFHLKTAGTSWLEAMLLVAQKQPALYREVHAFALEAFAEASQYYHVTTDLAKIPDVTAMEDKELPKLFTQNDARQLIHITYGLILSAKNADGSDRFKTRLYQTWRKNADAYASLLEKHIGNHIKAVLGK